MRATKKKVSMSSLGKQHTKVHLERFYPWLKDNDFPTLTKDDVSEKNYDAKMLELMPNQYGVNNHYLNALYTYQQCDTKHKMIYVSKGSIDTAKR